MIKTLKSIVVTIYNNYLEDSGKSPTSLIEYLKSHPEALPVINDAPKTVCQCDVVKWHNWHHSIWEDTENDSIRSGKIRGWRNFKNGYFGADISIPGFGSIVRKEEYPLWECDIQDVQGLSNSKSDLSKYADLDDFTEKKTYKLADVISKESLERALSHTEIRIIHSPIEHRSDCFVSYGWDNRLFLINSGGSHHFAAARYIAKRIDQKISLRGKMVAYSLHIPSVELMVRECFIVAINEDNWWDVHNAFKKFKASYGWLTLPRPYTNTGAVFLPKNEPRSFPLAETLLAAGAFNLGKYLEDLALKQPQNRVHAE